MKELQRLEMLLGKSAIDRLWKSHVAVFGIGGVGSYTAEALARSGIGTISLFDDDVVCESNLNRQLIALHSTIGQKKVEVMANRIKDINPQITVNAQCVFYTPETHIDFSQFDYVVDAIDTVSSKLAIIENCKTSQTPVISSMGTGNKLNPFLLQVADISKTSVCPLARVMRKELRSRRINNVDVLFSTEEPKSVLNDDFEALGSNFRRSTPGSTAFVPSCAGLMLAGEIVKTIASKED